MRWSDLLPQTREHIMAHDAYDCSCSTRHQHRTGQMIVCPYHQGYDDGLRRGTADEQERIAAEIAAADDGRYGMKSEAYNDAARIARGKS